MLLWFSRYKRNNILIWIKPEIVSSGSRTVIYTTFVLQLNGAFLKVIAVSVFYKVTASTRIDGLDEPQEQWASWNNSFCLCCARWIQIRKHFIENVCTHNTYWEFSHFNYKVPSSTVNILLCDFHTAENFLYKGTTFSFTQGVTKSTTAILESTLWKYSENDTHNHLQRLVLKLCHNLMLLTFLVF